MEKQVEGLKYPKHSTYSVSLSVLERDHVAKGADLLNGFEQQTLKAVLYKYGFNLSKGVTYIECEHRNVYGERVNCPLFMGVERKDERWLALKRKVT